MGQVDLPIFEIEQRLRDALSTGSRLVLTAPTGSGKSTQVPQMLLDGGLLGAGQVTVLQPRRLPTRMLASWVAQARGVKLGGEVGYRMRLDNVASAATRICYVTEGDSLAPDVGRSPAERRQCADLRRIPRTPSLRRHFPGARAANPGNNPARSDDHRHVCDLGCRRGGKVSATVHPVGVPGTHLSGRC